MATPLNREASLAVYAEAIRSAVVSVPESTHRSFVDVVVKADQIVTAGRGRSGMMASAFARRLGQMGLRAWGLDDTTVPRLGKGDLLVACTGSGTTPTVLSLMDTARSGGASVVAVTRAPSGLDQLADVDIPLVVPPGGDLYPLGTLFEVALLAYLDHVVVDLLLALGKTESELGARHTNLE